MRNLVTDIAGVRVGHAANQQLASGVTALLFDAPAIASVAIHGGAPGLRDNALLEPSMSVERVNAIVLSGGSVYGLDAMGGTIAFLRELGRGFPVRDIKVPIVPGAILFDLLNGGDKEACSTPVYWHLGYAAAQAAADDFALGSAGAGLGATIADLKGGLGSASTKTSNGFLVGALVAVNAIGRATISRGPHFWAAPYEQNGEFGGLGLPSPWPMDGADFQIKGESAENTTIAVVVTDALLSKADAQRLAVMAHDGMARALRPSHAPMDGDTIFAAAIGTAAKPPSLRDKTEIGSCGADCLARAIARAIYEASPLPFPGALPSWTEKYAKRA
jgi:L-aminopeptidase/D-esterase-like protein